MGFALAVQGLPRAHGECKPLLHLSYLPCGEAPHSRAGADASPLHQAAHKLPALPSHARLPHATASCGCCAAPPRAMQVVSFVGAVMPLVYAGVAFVSVLVSSLGSNRCSLTYPKDYGTHVAAHSDCMPVPALHIWFGLAKGLKTQLSRSAAPLCPCDVVAWQGGAGGLHGCGEGRHPGHSDECAVGVSA